jgi:hypothetical protein
MPDERQRAPIVERLIAAQPPERLAALAERESNSEAARYPDHMIEAIAGQIEAAGNNRDLRFNLQRILALMQGRQPGGLFGSFGNSAE